MLLEYGHHKHFNNTSYCGIQSQISRTVNSKRFYFNIVRMCEKFNSVITKKEKKVLENYRKKQNFNVFDSGLNDAGPFI